MAKPRKGIAKVGSFVEKGKGKVENHKYVEKEEGEVENHEIENEKDDDFLYKPRIMAVEDDIVCLKLLEALLLNCGYKVTAMQHAPTALQMLRDNRGNYDLVITDVRMPEMDGFMLLEIISLEMDLPVIMLSYDDQVSTIVRGLTHGACDYLLKPVRIQELKIIWKHLIHKPSNIKEDTAYRSIQVINPEGVGTSKPKEELTTQKRERDIDEELAKQKKPRFNWSKELHDRFLHAVNQLGMDGLGPKKILDLMNEPGLTRDIVASHLQKYRKALKKTEEARRQYINASTSEGFVEAYQNRTISHDHQSDNGHKHMVSSWPSHHLLSQNNLSQQYVSSTQASQLSKHPSSRPFIPTLKQPYDHIESFRSHWTNYTNSAPNSTTPAIFFDSTNSPQVGIKTQCQDHQLNDGMEEDLQMILQSNGISLTGTQKDFRRYSFAESSLPSRTFGNSNIQSTYVPQERINTLLEYTNPPQVGLKDNNLDVQMLHQYHQLNAGTGEDFHMRAQSKSGFGDSYRAQSKSVFGDWYM